MYNLQMVSSINIWKSLLDMKFHNNINLSNNNELHYIL